MKTIRSLSLVAAGVLATLAISPAQAVELQQKFQVGQSLRYDLTMNGTANVKVPSDAPIFFAGVPLEIDLNGKGVAKLDTLEVDPMGVGTIFLGLPKFDLNGSTFGQKVRLELREGQTRVLFNGKPIALPKPDPKNPPKMYGLMIGRDGRLKGFKELDKNGKLLTANANAAPEVRDVADDMGEDETVAPGAAIDKGALFTSIILRALPTLWPKGDVQPGDSWKTTLPLPAAFARNAEAAQKAVPLSKWTMTLKGEEMVDGVSLWRVGILGGIEVDGDSLPKPDAPKKEGKPVGQLENLSNTVDGDLWFDAAEGRIVRGDMVVDARAQGHTIDSKGRNSDPSWGDFTGTFGLRLQK